MQDFLLQPDENGIYDLVVEDSQFASSDGFETAVVTSLYTDARAPEVQVPEASNRRGWVGNALDISRGLELGGLLWLLSQKRMTDETLNLARSYSKDSFQWMLTDNVAQNIDIQVTQTDKREIKIAVSITDLNNTIKRYITLWRTTDLTRIIS